MIRVLQVVTRLVVRGVPRHVLDLAAGLSTAGLHVDVAAGRGEEGEGSLWEEAAARGIHTIHVPTLVRPVSPVADLRALPALYRIMRRGRYHVVHTHISKAGILGRLAARAAGVPVVVHTYHGAVGEISAPGRAGSLFRWAERLSAQWSDALISVSGDTARRFLAMGIGVRGQYRIIHNGIDVEHFAQWRGLPPHDIPPGVPILGFVGSLTAEKRVGVLLQALRRLEDDVRDAHLFVVGDGPLRGTLERLAARLNLENSVHFVGLVEDVRPWLGHFDVLVAPSGSEGLPTVLLEALAMGCPVVASRVGGIPEIIEDEGTGILVDPGNAAALGQALSRLLHDEEKRVLMGRKGRETARERFGLARMLQRTEALYRELLEGRDRPA